MVILPTGVPVAATSTFNVPGCMANGGASLPMVRPAVAEQPPPMSIAGLTLSRYRLVMLGISGYFMRLPSPALWAMTSAVRSSSLANGMSGCAALSCLTPSRRFFRYMPP